MKIAELQDYLPHRPPAVWIDEVTEEACFVDLKSNAAYFSNERLRESSLIEFIAQSYGYRLAFQIVRTGVKPQAATKAFLVAVTKCTLQNTTALKADDRLKITIGDVKSLGPITMFTSQVTDASGTEYARASLKVFSE